MKAVIKLQLILIGVCSVEPSCDGRENGAQCFGVLGGAVDVQLMDNVLEIPRFWWKMNNSVILYWRNNTVVTPKDDRIPFFPSNGTVRINDLRRTDSGEYKLEMFDRNGFNIGWRTLQLFVIAPVSSVQLVHECFSQGQMKVSCVSQGDSPQYSWTLDGHTLTNSELFSRNTKTNIIVLRQNISGHLICSVRNQVSNSSEGMNLTYCGLSSWLTLGLRTIAVALPLIGLCLYFTWKQRKYEKAKSSAIPSTEENPENSVLMVQLSSAP